MRGIGDYIYGHKNAAQWLRDHGYIVGGQHLNNLKHEGKGPKTEMHGKTVAYPIKELEAWMNARLSKVDGRIMRSGRNAMLGMVHSKDSDAES